MKKVGLKYPVYAIYDDGTGTAKYTNGAVMGKAMSAAISYTKSNVKLYADDAVDEMDQSITGMTISFGVNELTHEKQSTLLGHKYISGELTINELDVAPYVGFGYYGKVKRDGQNKYRTVWLPKVQFGEPNDETNTKGESTVFQTPTIEGEGMKDINGDFKKEKLFDTEADAVAWLNTKAGIPITASTGITALDVVGAGGALSPVFGSSTRYYTFSGLTAASFTVKVTAANHAIQLYVDDALVQNLTSGVVSSAIPMATGSKKVRIVVQENGKTSQTTEIIAVKTA